MNHKQNFKLLATSLAIITLAGCANLKPKALQDADIVKQAQTVKGKQTAAVEPINGPLSLEEAIARAVKYNAERQVRIMEEAMAYGTLDLANFDMLPKFMANAGYRSRDSDLLTNLRAGPDSPITEGNTISSARKATTTDLSFTWSLLDFGQSYYAAKQSGDRLMIATERRRKALHNLVQDVRTAYWRVVAAEKLGQSVRNTMQEAEAALKGSEAAESSAMRSPMEPLRFQRQLLENLRMLELVEHELSSARIELATLAALPSGSNFTVVEPQAQINTKWLDMNPADMELQAVVNNPDMRESLYNARIARDEAKRAMLKMFPGITFSYGNRTTNDEYIVNQRWNEAGAQISFNLMGILSAPTAKRLADMGISIADQRQVATQMAVISQVHIARLNYANAAKQYMRADKIARVDNRMAEVVASRAKAESQSRQESVAQQTASILSALRRYQALSNAQAAASRLQATLGLEPVLQAAEGKPLPEVVQAVQQSLKTWEAGELPKLPAGLSW
ncbi:TolC family protein [Limnohabitans sp.]|uniref:TolC family protein n=1 Tax=Limnohabitans sp. TaxID=1907725 RepID=UPI0025BDE095|nr:TolC family protein [Limnohabitans sp.]